MRHDVIIIWGHGLPDLDGVLDLVRASPDFQIHQILIRDIDDMPRFVRSVYNFDYAPYRHLIDKTKYLLSVPPKAAFIVLNNLNPNEHTVGQGRFAHTECQKMTALKRAIRERYNPHINGKPSEHHIVHGTDHTGQTLATLKLLGFRNIQQLDDAQRTTLDTPSHLPPRQAWTLQKIDLSKVYARIANKPGSDLPHTVMPIDQTPHALFAHGEREPYEHYWQTQRGERLQEDHAPKAFENLINQFDYLSHDYPDSYLLLEEIDENRFVLLDGVHRASILRSQGVQHVIAAVANASAATTSNTTPGVIDLPAIFNRTNAHDFVVMKTLPKAKPEIGSDIDLLCRDKTTLGKQLLRNSQPLISLGYTLRLRELPETDQTHLDIMHGNQIALRLDLHEGLGAYRRVPIKGTFTTNLLARRTWADLTCPTGSIQLPIPDTLDNLVLRYLEYHEWFDARPDKIKHADHIAQAFANDPASAHAFYERLMQATNQRPSHPALRYCDLNLKRQLIWAYWSLRDKLAWRLKNARHLCVMAASEPTVFTRKLLRKLTPAPLRPPHKAH